MRYRGRITRKRTVRLVELLRVLEDDSETRDTKWEYSAVHRDVVSLLRHGFPCYRI